MQSRHANTELVTGIIAGAVTLAAGPDASPPEWIKITPNGNATTRDGRSFSFDPALLATRFAADGTDLAVDTDHSVALLATKGLAPNVVGYVKAVEARADGTYGRVDWIDPAKAASTFKTHRYVSPTMQHDAQGNVTWLHSVALVSAPALGNMPSLAHSDPQGNPMKQIAKALGLPESATEEACLAALAARTEVKPLAAALGLPETADAPACLTAISTLKGGAGDKALVATLQADLKSTGEKLSAVVKAGRDRDVAELLDGAQRDRKMVPAERDHLARLCATDDGLAGVRALLSSRVPGLGPSGLDGRVPPGDGAINPVTLAAEAAAMVEKGEAPDIAAAVTRLAAKKG